MYTHEADGKDDYNYWRKERLDYLNKLIENGADDIEDYTEANFLLNEIKKENEKK